jgi:hypothetical protein
MRRRTKEKSGPITTLHIYSTSPSLFKGIVSKDCQPQSFSSKQLPQKPRFSLKNLLANVTNFLPKLSLRTKFQIALFRRKANAKKKYAK